MQRYKIGVVGLGFGMHIVRDQLARGPGAPYFELAAVCSLDREKTRPTAAEFGIKSYDSVDELLADPDIPVIGLFTGPAGRAELLSRIVRAGKDVMTTKPFELDPDAARRVLQEARQLGRIIHLNSPSPLLSAELAHMALWRETYGIGQPVAACAEVWCAYRERADGSWYDDPAQCPVAPIFRLGIYLINDLVRFCGPVDAVQVVHSRLFTDRPTPDNALLTLRFANGAVGSVWASFCVADGEPYKNSLTLHFARGTLYRNVGLLPAGHGHGTSRLGLTTLCEGRRVTAEATVQGASGEYQWDASHRAIGGERLEGEATVAEIVEGVCVCAAMRRAERSGAVERVRRDP